MKPIVFITAILGLYSVPTQAQLFLQNGASITTTAGAVITLQDIDLQSNGTISQQPGSGRFVFNGSSNTSISGTSIPLFDILEIAKTGGAVLKLGQNINIGSFINFTSGLIDPVSSNIQLNADLSTAPPAYLIGESEISRISGLTGGSVAISSNAVVNAPSALNPGNIGASVTSAANLGNLSITRTNLVAVNPGNAAQTGIQRIFFIQPQNNAALNATLRFYYFTAELNAKDPNTLTLWKSTDGINWANVGVDAFDLTNKYVEKTGIADFSYWTLTDASTPLPIKLVSFQATCQNNAALLQWQTASEDNAASFLVERSTDGNSWTELQSIAARNSSLGASYSFLDKDPMANEYYRLKMIDIDGKYTWSPVFMSNCSGAAMPFVVYPNPAHNTALARISVRQATKSTLYLYNMEGRLLAQYEWPLQTGLNNFNVPNIPSLPAGTYTIKVQFNGTCVQTKLLKD